MLASTQAPIVWTVSYAMDSPLEILYFSFKKKKKTMENLAQNVLEVELPCDVFPFSLC